MSRARKVALGAAALAVLLVGGVAWYLGPIAPIATGYAAKITCSAHLLAERDLDAALGDLPDNPLVPFLRTSVDPAAGEVSTTLLGAWRSTAYLTEGLGCTLADERPAFTALPALDPPDPAVAWPDGDGPADPPADVDIDALDAAIATAFTEDDPDGRLRNTRAVVVVRDGRLIAERYADGFDADTPLLGWSMGKSVANAIIGRLVHQGVFEGADLGPDGGGQVPGRHNPSRFSV